MTRGWCYFAALPLTEAAVGREVTGLLQTGQKEFFASNLEIVKKCDCYPLMKTSKSKTSFKVFLKDLKWELFFFFP